MKDSNLQKIKDMFRDPIVRTILISFATVIVTITLITFIAWQYRTQVFKVLGINSTTDVKSSDSNLIYDSTTPSENSQTQIPPVSSDVARQDSVINAVKTAKPAVVSIVVSKIVPKYDISYDSNNDSFGGMFPGFFQTPIYKENGTEKKKIGSGSGFLISSDGMIVTNRHVVEDKTATYDVLLNNGKMYSATVLARDGVLDVALLKIGVSNQAYLQLGDSDALQVGQSVIAIGNALGEFKNSVSVGVVSGLSRSVIAGDSAGQSERLDKVIQTDAAINPGNSGGPLLNLRGDVIGINVAVVQGSSNVGFALPINSVKSAIASVKATGKIIRPYVGIRYLPVTAELKAKNNLSVDYGILVQRGATAADIAVVPGSPADKAGIVENDIILEVDGEKMDQEQDFSSIIRAKKVGDSINVKVLSKDSQKFLSIRLEVAPDGM